MTKTLQWILKLSGGILLLLGAACLLFANLNRLNAIFFGKVSAEYQDYED